MSAAVRAPWKRGNNILLLDGFRSHNAVEIGVPEEHSAVIARGWVKVKDQRVGTVLLPADVRDVITNHCFLRGWIHSIYAICGREEEGWEAVLVIRARLGGQLLFSFNFFFCTA